MSDGTQVNLELGDSDYTDTASVDSNGDATFSDVTVGSNDYGTFDVLVYEDADQTNNVSVSNVVFDGEEPQINSESPSDAITDQTPDIEATFEDEFSGLTETWINFDADGDEINSSTTSLSGADSDTREIDFSDNDFNDLGDGSYTVDYGAKDEAGNSISSSWSFVVDTVDPDPDNVVFEDEDGDEIEETDYDVEGENDFPVDVSFDATNDHESTVTATCLVNGEDEGDETFDLEDNTDYDFTCDIDEDYFDGDVDFEFRLEDDAGNDWTSDSVTFGLDESDPTVSTVESVSGLGVFNSDFDVSYEAFDSVSEIDQAEYFFDESTDEGEGSEVSDGEFTVDTSDLDEGEHELFVRAQDGVGKWSETDSFTFDFYPDEEPEASLNVAESLNVTSGSTEDLEVEIENTGVILVPSGTVSVSSFGSNESFESVAPEESTTVDVELSPGEDDLGENTLSVELDGVNASAEVDVLVKASEDVQDDIESDLDDYASDYENLSSRVESLRSELSQERKDRLDSDFSEVESSVQEAQDAVDNGEYYMAEEIVSDLESQMQSVEETYSTVEEEQRIDNRNTLIGLGLGLFLLLIASGVGFVAYSDEYELDISALQDLDVPAIGNIEEEEEEDSGYSHSEEEDQSDEGLVDKIKSKIDELKGGEESEDEGPEYEFK